MRSSDDLTGWDELRRQKDTRAEALAKGATAAAKARREKQKRQDDLVKRYALGIKLRSREALARRIGENPEFIQEARDVGVGIGRSALLRSLNRLRLPSPASGGRKRDIR